MVMTPVATASTVANYEYVNPHISTTSGMYLWFAIGFMNEYNLYSGCWRNIFLYYCGR